jgi:hypothetical protein
MRGTRLLGFYLITSIALAACGSTGGGAVALTASADRPDARVTVSADTQLTVVEIFSPSGIGGAQAEITSAALPQKIVLRLHLHGLEQLRFTYGNTTVTASLSSTGDHGIQQSFQDSGPEQAITASSPYWMNIRIVPANGSPATIPLQNGYIEVDTPADFLARSQTKFAIQWIDFFR